MQLSHEDFLYVQQATLFCSAGHANCSAGSATHISRLADLEAVIRDSQCTDIFLAGDLNCDFRRQTKFSSLVKNCMTDLGLLIT